MGSRAFTSLGKPLIVFSLLRGRSMNMVIRVGIAGSIKWKVIGRSNFPWGLCVMSSSNASGIGTCDQRESLVLGKMRNPRPKFKMSVDSVLALAREHMSSRVGSMLRSPRASFVKLPPWATSCGSRHRIEPDSVSEGVQRPWCPKTELSGARWYLMILHSVIIGSGYIT